MVSKKRISNPIAGVSCLLFFILPSVGWAISGPIPGDVNSDGKIDILDIQQGINIAIGVSDFSEVADVNNTLSVDVLDIQILINTVLGTGGLVQSVSGTVVVSSEQLSNSIIKIVALSSDGRIIVDTLSPSGGFRILLPVGVNWSIGALLEREEGYEIFPFYFPVLNQDNLSFPLLDVSLGYELCLGSINISPGSAVRTTDLRHLLGIIAERLPSTDENSNNLPDIYENLFNIWREYFQKNTYLQYFFSNDASFQQFLRDVGNCVAPNLDVILTPSLNLFETEGFPEMLLPIVQCMKNICVSYLSQLGIPLAESIVNTFYSQISPMLGDSLSEWLNSLNISELTDLNNNRVPDFIEENICINNTTCLFDQNNNGIPDFLDDTDGDGVPNFLDPDSRTELDVDGDGIPNDLDLDANGNGILDYAENSSK